MEGYCKLTGQFGKYVDSHIIPKSLTKPETSGAPLLESTKGRGFKRRWSSWVDPQLVIRAGEDVLARIDDNGIKELRHHQLIWSSWQIFKPNFERLLVASPAHSIRKIRVRDSRKIRLFALSILWRAAASNLVQMSTVSASVDDLEKLRRIVLGELPIMPDTFPISVIQLSTIGTTHNQSPYEDIKKTPAYGDIPSREQKFVRVYMDGLIFHIHWDSGDFENYDNNALLLGCSEYLYVSAVDFSSSFQYENLLWNGYESVFTDPKSKLGRKPM